MEENKCKCSGTCTCGENCECTEETRCSDECTCGNECKCDENCTCEEDDCQCEHDKKEKKQKKIKDKRLDKLNEAYNKISELEDRLLREKAELVNYRKRKEEEISRLLKYSNEDLVKEILPIVDNFERAINMDDDNLEDEVSKFLSGFKMIYCKLVSTLEKYEVKAIDGNNKPFDPTYHQAVLTEQREGVEKGYEMLNDPNILFSACQSFADYRRPGKQESMDYIASNNKAAIYLNNELDVYYARNGDRKLPYGFDPSQYESYSWVTDDQFVAYGRK